MSQNLEMVPLKETAQTKELRAIADKKRFIDHWEANDLDQECDDLEEELGEETDSVHEGDNDLSKELGKDDLTSTAADSGEGGNLEPQDLDDDGDSEKWLCERSESPYDSEWSETAPLISQLPRRARPIVRFAIDEKYNVSPLDLLDDPQYEIRHMLALAVAAHLKRHRVKLVQPGDWCQIPAIRSEDELLRLASASETDDKDVETLIEIRVATRRAQKARYSSERSRLQRQLDDHLKIFSALFQRFYARLKDYGKHLKAMGISLPNGDVVTVGALFFIAREGKSSTLAAALRSARRRPSTLAGEEWQPTDWDGFEESQRKASYRKKKVST